MKLVLMLTSLIFQKQINVLTICESLGSNMNLKSVLVLCFSVLLLFSTFDIVFASHGSSGGGGCSGDCSPPTLGTNNQGQTFVEHGISINNNSFDVSYYQQEIPTQILKLNEPATISLKIYENSGPSFLTHVFLLLGVEEARISGVPVQLHPVQIIWENPRDGPSFVSIEDPKNLVSDVSVESNLGEDVFGTVDNVAEITFHFTPIQKFDTDTIMIKMWDYKNNSWTNHFYNSLIIEDAEFSDDVIFSEENNLPSEIPSWLKNNAKYWAENQIDDATFLVGIKYLIEQEIIDIPNLQDFQPEPLVNFMDDEKGAQYYLDKYYGNEVYREWFDNSFPEYTIEESLGISTDQTIPGWIKNNAKMWTNNMITDDDFLNGIEFLIKKGIILL